NFGTDVQIIADGTPQKRLLIKFTVTGVGTRTITSAKLSLRCVDPSAAGGTFHRVADQTWTELGVNWNNQPAIDTGVLATLGSVTSGTTYTVDVTPAITGDGTYTIEADSTNADGRSEEH